MWFLRYAFVADHVHSRTLLSFLHQKSCRFSKMCVCLLPSTVGNTLAIWLKKPELALCRAALCSVWWPYLEILAYLKCMAVSDPLLLRETPQGHLIVEHRLRFRERLQVETKKAVNVNVFCFLRTSSWILGNSDQGDQTGRKLKNSQS